MNDEARSFDVPQELLPEARAFARAFDEAGDVRDNELAVVEASDAQVGRERREGIVRDLRAGACQRSEKARLAGVRQAGQADVGDKPQLQLELALFARLTVLRDPRHTPRARCESRVTTAAPAAARDDDLLARRDEIRDDLAGRDILHGRARWDLEDEIATGLAGFVLSATGIS